MELINWYFWLSFIFAFTVISYILIHILVRMTARMVVRNMEKTKESTGLNGLYLFTDCHFFDIVNLMIITVKSVLGLAPSEPLSMTISTSSVPV